MEHFHPNLCSSIVHRLIFNFLFDFSSNLNSWAMVMDDINGYCVSSFPHIEVHERKIDRQDKNPDIRRFEALGKLRFREYKKCIRDELTQQTKEFLEPETWSSDDEDDPELTALIRLVECPICKDVPVPPIYNCQNGHLICDSCRVRLASQNCGYCCAQITRMRNYPVESLVSTPSIKCDYIEYGCSKKLLSLGEYDDHVRKCWAKYWRPGKITFNCDTQTKEIDRNEDNLSEEGASQCPKCSQANPSRKIKCQFCNTSLRPPTPMFLSPSSTDDNDQVEFECEYVTSIWKDLELAFQML